MDIQDKIDLYKNARENISNFVTFEQHYGESIVITPKRCGWSISWNPIISIIDPIVIGGKYRDYTLKGIIPVPFQRKEIYTEHGYLTCEFKDFLEVILNEHNLYSYIIKIIGYFGESIVINYNAINNDLIQIT